MKKETFKRTWREIVSVLLVAVMVFTMMPALRVNAAGDKASSDEAGLVNYRTHVQTYGWQDWKADGAMSGTSGQAKRLECIEIKLGDTGYEGGVMYRTHVQSKGWLQWANDGMMSGTFGMGKRLEGIEISLYGEVSEHYDIYYRVHVQSYGWQDWVCNGMMAGTSGKAKRLEGIEIKLVEKKENAGAQILYRTHVQTYGWQDWKTDGAMSGTSGKAKRLEGIQIMLNSNEYSGGVKYSTHVQTYGWQDDRYNGAMSGTSGESKRLEAIKISLYGDIEKYYDIYYRVHVQTYGWQDWVCNGELAGTSGKAKRLEGIEIKLVKKEGVTSEKKEPLKLELSGKAEDIYTITEECYVEGEDVVIYLPKGITVKGDMLKIIEKIMADLCETTELNFDNNHYIKNPMECRDLFYEEGLFADINKDADKVNLLFIDEGENSAWASEHNAVVDITYFEGDYQTIYHELSHVLQFRNGIDLGSVMDEGYATYTSYICQMEHGMPGWSAAQYFWPAEDVAKPLIEGGEDAFSIVYDVKDTNYQYGFRFVLYLSETYGEDIYYKIMDAAEKSEFKSSWNQDTEKEDKARNSDILIEVIKSQTSEDVFEDFADWYANDWDSVVEEKMAEIEAMSN